MTVTNTGSLICNLNGNTRLFEKREVEEALKARFGNGLFSQKDDIVEAVREKYHLRSKEGRITYSSTLQDNNKCNYLLELQEELMDSSLYIQKLLQQKEDITQLCKEYSNDQELGNTIRKKYAI